MSLVPPQSTSQSQASPDAQAGSGATQLWMRFERLADGRRGFGTLEGNELAVHDGDLFAAPTLTSERLKLDAIRVLTPTQPSKLIGLWNNFGALAEKLQLSPPPEPLYFVKTSNSYLASGETIRQPKAYRGRVVFEGELGIVVGKTCKDVDEANGAGCIFGYTCVNDVTAVDVLNADATFAQWARAKSYDTFGAFGPVIATGLDPSGLTIVATLAGQERQRYPASDMLFAPARLVSLLSHDMTLFAGDVIACGTSNGAGKMKPGNVIEVTIEGIGTLRNTFLA